MFDVQEGQTIIHCIQPFSCSIHSRAQKQTQVKLNQVGEHLGQFELRHSELSDLVCWTMEVRYASGKQSKLSEYILYHSRYRPTVDP
jgi:hypothetical protein